MAEYRVLVLGSAAVGKSTLTIQFVQNVFVDVYNPTVEDSYRKAVTIDEELLMLDILDTAGVEDFSAVRQHYMKTGHGFLCVYSITSKYSFTQVAQFHEDILQIKDSAVAPIVIVGNKCDMALQREVPTEVGRKYAEKFGLPFFETSGKLRTNVDEAFMEVVRQILKYSIGGTRKKPKKDRKSYCILM